MIDKEQAQLISEVSRDLVTQLAPGELPVFEATRESYFEDPDRVLRGEHTKDEILGFGLEGMVGQMTPVILAVMTQVIAFLSGELKKQLQTESQGFLSDVVKKMFKKFRQRMDPESAKAPAAAAAPPTAPAEPPAVPANLLSRVREVTLQNASRLELPKDRAEMLADAVVGSLVLAPAG
jgi:hypothetical protein